VRPEAISSTWAGGGRERGGGGGVKAAELCREAVCAVREARLQAPGAKASIPEHPHLRQRVEHLH
jgi:hypothetical protein